MQHVLKVPLGCFIYRPYIKGEEDMCIKTDTGYQFQKSSRGAFFRNCRSLAGKNAQKQPCGGVFLNCIAGSPCSRFLPPGSCIQNKKPETLVVSGFFSGLGERIRTSGLLNPIQARYQTAPHPGNGIIVSYLPYHCNSFWQENGKFYSKAGIEE